MQHLLGVALARTALLATLALDEIGTSHAAIEHMAILNDLIVYQLADQLRAEVIRLTGDHRVAKEFRLRDQLRGAAGSVVANIAEGYGRSSHADFARFLDVAAGSLRETEEWIRDGIARGIWTPAEANASMQLCIRLTRAVSRLKRYLRNSKTPSF